MQTSLPFVRKIIAQDWSRIRHQTTRWLQLPSTLGGLNLAPFEGWVSSRPWPKLQHPKVRMSAEPGSERRLAQRFEQWKPTGPELTEIQQLRMNSMATSDDVRGIGAIHRALYKEELEKMGPVEWKKVNISRFSIEGIRESIIRLASANDVRDLRWLWDLS